MLSKNLLRKYMCCWIKVRWRWKSWGESEIAKWHLQTWPSFLLCIHTVVGRNPAPVDMVNIPLFTGFYTSQVVQDFFHQQYHHHSFLSVSFQERAAYDHPGPTTAMDRRAVEAVQNPWPTTPRAPGGSGAGEPSGQGGWELVVGYTLVN